MGYRYNHEAYLLFHYPNKDGAAYLIPLSALNMCQPVTVVLDQSHAADIEWLEVNQAPIIRDIKVKIPALNPLGLRDKLAGQLNKQKEIIIVAQLAQITSTVPPHPVMGRHGEHTGKNL